MSVTYVDLGELNQYLAKGKLTFSQADLDDEADMEMTQSRIIFGRLSRAYDTTEWVDSATTPSLIRSLIAMRMAAYVWLRAHGDIDKGLNSYGMLLLDQNDELLKMIEDGEIGLEGVTYDESASSSETYAFTDPNFTIGQVF